MADKLFREEIRSAGETQDGHGRVDQYGYPMDITARSSQLSPQEQREQDEFFGVPVTQTSGSAAAANRDIPPLPYPGEPPSPVKQYQPHTNQLYGDSRSNSNLLSILNAKQPQPGSGTSSELLAHPTPSVEQLPDLARLGLQRTSQPSISPSLQSDLTTHLGPHGNTQQFTHFSQAYAIQGQQNAGHHSSASTESPPASHPLQAQSSIAHSAPAISTFSNMATSGPPGAGSGYVPPPFPLFQHGPAAFGPSQVGPPPGPIAPNMSGPGHPLPAPFTHIGPPPSTHQYAPQHQLGAMPPAYSMPPQQLPPEFPPPQHPPMPVLPPPPPPPPPHMSQQFPHSIPPPPVGSMAARYNGLPPPPLVQASGAPPAGHAGQLLKLFDTRSPG